MSLWHKMITLDELKNRLMKEYDLHPSKSVPHFSSSVMEKVSQLMLENPEKVQEIEEYVGKGEEFRLYFSDKSYMRKLIQMHKDDVDGFYRILRKEELFLNTCLQTFGLKNAIIQLDPDTLLNNLEDQLDDTDSDDENEDI